MHQPSCIKLDEQDTGFSSSICSTILSFSATSTWLSFDFRSSQLVGLLRFPLRLSVDPCFIFNHSFSTTLLPSSSMIPLPSDLPHNYPFFDLPIDNTRLSRSFPFGQKWQRIYILRWRVLGHHPMRYGGKRVSQLHRSSPRFSGVLHVANIFSSYGGSLFHLLSSGGPMARRGHGFWAGSRLSTLFSFRLRGD